MASGMRMGRTIGSASTTAPIARIVQIIPLSRQPPKSVHHLTCPLAAPASCSAHASPTQRGEAALGAVGRRRHPFRVLAGLIGVARSLAICAGDISKPTAHITGVDLGLVGGLTRGCGWRRRRASDRRGGTRRERLRGVSLFLDVERHPHRHDEEDEGAQCGEHRVEEFAPNSPTVDDREESRHYEHRDCKLAHV